MPDFSVVIPSANPGNLSACLKALFDGEPELPQSRVVVVDDGGAEGAARFPGVRVVPGARPFVFSRNCNIGIRASEGEAVLLLNDDALLETPGGLSTMARDALADDLIGVCSAAVRGCGKPVQTPLLDLGIVMVDRPVNFCCVLIPSLTFSVIGGLDESFTGYGYEDDSFCLSAWKAGLKVAVHHGCVVRHEGRAGVRRTYGYLPEFFALTDEAAKLFKEKWPGESGAPTR